MADVAAGRETSNTPVYGRSSFPIKIETAIGQGRSGEAPPEFLGNEDGGLHPPSKSPEPNELPCRCAVS
jgi:hypothetical protein